MYLCAGRRYAQTLILLFVNSTPVLAAEKFNLGEVIVSGEQPRVVESVGTVDIVTAEDIRLSGARNLNEAIKLLPGLYVRTGGDGTPRIDIRGLRTRQVTLLLDGVPINSSIDGQFDPSAIDVANISSIKVTRGGGSVLYGAGGSAGVINIITRAGSRGFSGRALAELGEHGTKQGQISAGGGSENLRGFASVSGYNRNNFELSDDYDPIPVTGAPTPNNFEDGEDRLNSDRQDTNFYGNLLWTGLPRTEVGMSASYREGEYGKPPETRDNSGGDADPFARRPKFERVDDFDGFSINLTARHELPIPLTIKPALYYNRLDELTNNYDNANFNTQVIRRASSTDAHSVIYGANLLLSYDFEQLGKSSLAGDCRREKWDADGFTIETGANVFTPFTINQHDSICSVGFEQEVTLFDRLGLVGGIGTAWQEKKTGNDESGDTYLVGASLDVLPQTRVYASHAKKIRFATLRDLFEPGRANPDLTSETTFHYEAGIEQGFTLIPATVGITFFRINAEDYIETDGSGVAQNIEENRFQGVEATVQVTPITGLTVHGGYTFLDSENLSTGVLTTHLQNRPEHQLSVDLTYRVPHWDTELYLSWLHIERQIEIERGNNPARTQETGDYDVLDMKLIKSFGEFSLYGRALNLLDEDYVESGGFPAPGRTILVGGEMNFGS